MMEWWTPIPYPIYKSPLESDRADWEQDWQLASSTDPVFAFRVGQRNVTHQEKLGLLQRVFWPALARSVEARQRVFPDGEIQGGWWRADMMGMLDWYRSCLKLTSRYRDATVAHGDGVWRVALETSPWFDWPEFHALLWEPVLVDDDETSELHANSDIIAYKKRDPRHADMEDAFMDLWTDVANKRPLRKDATGNYILPVNALGKSKYSESRHSMLSSQTIAQRCFGSE